MNENEKVLTDSFLNKYPVLKDENTEVLDFETSVIFDSENLIYCSENECF